MITEIVKAFDESRDAMLDRLPGDVRTYRDLFSVTLEEINKHLPERQTFVLEGIQETEYSDGYSGDYVFTVMNRKAKVYCTRVGYGSCSGCDALLRALEANDPKQLQILALHMVQNMKGL